MSQQRRSRRQCTHIVIDAATKERIRKITEYATKTQPRCAGCKGPAESTWCCVRCFYIGCAGRDSYNHAHSHAQKDKHPVVISMQNTTSLFCFECNLNLTYHPRDEDSEDQESSSSATEQRRRPNGRAPPRRRQPAQRAPLFPPAIKWVGVDEILTRTPIWSSNIDGGLCGLVNLGNTCFMNSALQALLHCPPIIYLFTQPEILAVSRKHRVPLVEDFVELTYEMWHGQHRALAPRAILRDVMNLFQQFRGFGQQDAHEFLRCLIHHFDDMFQYVVPIYETETPGSKERRRRRRAANERSSRREESGKPLKIGSPPKGEEDSDDEPETKSRESEKENARAEERKQEEKEGKGENKTRKPKEHKATSLVSDLFCGEVISEVECLECHNRSCTKDILYDLSVQIPKGEMIERAVEERNAEPLKKPGWFGTIFNYIGITQQTVPIEMCLHTFCTSEDLMHTEKYQCDKCKRKVDALKRLSISKLPEVLMIHIKRFSHDSFWNGSSKVSTPVAFPLSAFDLGEYVHPEHRDRSHNKDTVYDLCSLVKHMGGTGGGHYIAYCKHPGTAHWYRFDDVRTEKSSPEKVSEQQAYILFYTRRRQHREYIPYIKKLLSAARSEEKEASSGPMVQMSRYWFHRVVSFSRPGPIENLWLSCHHGFPLKSGHSRRKDCSVLVSERVWNGLVKRFGVQYTTAVMYEEHDAATLGGTQEEETAHGHVEEDADGDGQARTDADTDGDAPMPEAQAEERTDETTQSAATVKFPWSLDVSSDRCEDCAKDEQKARREYEKTKIRVLEEEYTGPSDCALSMEWANKWRDWVYGRSEDVPGPVDNSGIVANEHMMKEGLKENEDYLLVSTPIWAFLLDLYGGGPKVVSTGRRRRKEKSTNASTDTKSRSTTQRSETSSSAQTESSEDLRSPPPRRDKRIARNHG